MRDNKGRYLKGFNGQKTHGMGHTRFHKTWCELKYRCNNTNNPKYGGRGIKCLWKSFEEFRDDMYELYLEHIKKYGRKNTQIDRINNNGHYCKKNCRWATLKQQARNKRNSRVLEYKGQRKSLAEWADIMGMNYKALEHRLNRSKWTVEKALTTPVKS